MVKQIYKKRFYKKNTNIENKLPDSLSTSTFLIIVESPSKCKKIEEYLGSQYTCISSKGHIRYIKDGLKSIDTKNEYTITYDIIEEKREHVIWMSEIISRFSKNNIILATDDDREGESIAWHICMIFELDINTTKRIIFHEITQPAIKTAIEHPVNINMNIVHAQIARQVLDMLVGFKISPVLWKHLYRSKENGLSAGRCQTPALKIVHDNEIESKKMMTTYKYKVSGCFFQKKILFHLSQEFENDSEVLHFLEESKGFSHNLSIGSQKESIKSPPKPFNTSSLLQKTSSLFSISPKEVMSICQQLYQDGFITYMRTESQKYSSDFIKKACEYITTKFAKAEYIGNTDEIENKESNNPHEAIRVTNIQISTIETENSRTLSVYKLIWRNSVESCMSSAKYYNTPITLTAPLDLHYKYTIEVPIFLGFMKFTEESKTVPHDIQNTGSALLLYLKSSKQTNIPYSSIKTTIAEHGKHSHYTEASLIKKLEDLGIGRPSTFAMIVDTNIERGYIKKTDIEGTIIKTAEYTLENGEIKKEEKEKLFGKESNKLIIQPLGIVVSNFLYKHFYNIFSYDYTTKMEEKLDEISLGRGYIWYKICDICNIEITELLKPIDKIGKQVIDIQDTDYKLVFEKYGPVLRRVENDTYEYKKIRTDIHIDLDKLQKGEYHISELIEEKKERIIGQVDGKDIFVKNGPYGEYIEYGDKRENIASFYVYATDEELLQKIKERIGSQKTDIKIIRVLRDDLSIRNGKFGAYIYYKTTKMTNPKFLNIQKFKESYRNCSLEILLKWIKDTYNI